MSFTITHRGGEMEEGDLSAIAALVAELDGPTDHEHPDVAVSRETFERPAIRLLPAPE